MNKFEINGPAQYPSARKFAITAAVLLVLVAVAGSWLTAGPGNWARIERQMVVLPTITVVGKREIVQPDNTVSASARPASVETDSPF